MNENESVAQDRINKWILLEAEKHDVQAIICKSWYMCGFSMPHLHSLSDSCDW